jgi:hypothetical protein
VARWPDGGALVIPALAHAFAFVLLKAGGATLVKAGMIVSVPTRGCARVLLHCSKEHSMTTRRHFTRFCTAAFLFGRRLLNAAGKAPLTWIAQPETIPGTERRYRADAQVMLLGIPFLHRANVGDGSAAWRESVSEDGTHVRLLEFAGRSAPERAGGLNRFGFIQELSRSGEAIYFGLMTSSPEESAAEARQALHSTSKEAWYSAIDGRVSDEGIETTRAHFVAAARTSPEQRRELIDQARRLLTAAPKTRTASPSAPPPFLNALAGLLTDSRKSEMQYAYNGSVYRLQVERSREAKTPGIVRIAGNLRRLAGGKPVDFRMWIEEGAAHPLPLRIEYQPKSYLKLTFEAV